MFLSEDAAPFALVERGEEDVGVFRGGVNVGEAETIRYGEGFTIDAGSADDEYLFVGASSKCSGKIGENLYVRPIQIGVAGQHDVTAIGQRAFRERLEGASSHDDGVAGGECLEAAQVFAEMVEEIVVIADGVVFGECADDGKHVMCRFFFGG